MSVTKQDCVNMLRQSGLSELDARQTVESMIEQKASLAAAGKLERGAADLVGAIRGVADEARQIIFELFVIKAKFFTNIFFP